MSTLHVPYVIERSPRGERTYDIFSRLLMDRIVFLGSEVNDDVANILIAQFLFLEADAPGKEIQFYINSPGGVVTAGLAIYDTMQHLTSPICTTCVGHGGEHGLLSARGRRQGTARRAAQCENHDASAVGRRRPRQRRRHRDHGEGDPAQSRATVLAARQAHGPAARANRARVRARSVVLVERGKALRPDRSRHREERMRSATRCRWPPTSDDVARMVGMVLAPAILSPSWSIA